MSIPAKPTLTTPPAAPQRTDPPTTFGNKADAYVTWQSGYRNELASAIDWQNTVFTATETVCNNAVQDTTEQKNLAIMARHGAETAQGAAETARDKSQEWAENPEDVEVETGQYSALHHAAKAEGYKDTAEAAAAAAQSAAGLPSLVGQAGNSLKVNGAEDGVEWGPGLIAEYQEFTASGTWTKDPNAQWVYVEAIGGGGGGANTDSSVPGAAGGGGGFNSALFRAADLSASETITVGSGGSGGAAGGDNSGLDGGSSSFGPFSARGGGGGQTFNIQIAGNGGGGEMGGTPGAEKGSGGYSSGGGGIDAGDGGSCVKGGAGGGGGGTISGSGGISLDGGNGGGGANGVDAQAGNGDAPGGGGGGCENNAGTSGGGGAGGDGVVRVWQW